MKFELDHWPFAPSKGDTDHIQIMSSRQVGRSRYYEVQINKDEYVIIRKSKFLWWTRYHFSGSTGMLNGMADTTIDINSIFFKECDQRKGQRTPLERIPDKRDEWILPSGISTARKLQDIVSREFHLEYIPTGGAATLLNAFREIIENSETLELVEN